MAPRMGLTAPSHCPKRGGDGGDADPLPSPVLAWKTPPCPARTELALTRGSDAAEGPPRPICQQEMQHLLSF